MFNNYKIESVWRNGVFHSSISWTTLINIMCVEVDELGNEAFTSHSIPKLPAAEASSNHQQKEKAEAKVLESSVLSSVVPIRFS